MSETPPIAPVIPVIPPPDKDANTLTIDLTGFDKLNDADKKAIASILSKQQADIDLLKKDNEAKDAKLNESEKKQLLAQLKQGNFNPEDFKDLDNKSLSALVTSLSKSKPGIIIDLKQGEGKPDPDFKEAQIWNPDTGLFEPFYKRSK